MSKDRTYRRKLKNYLFLDKPVQIHIALTVAIGGIVGGLVFLAGFWGYSEEILIALSDTAYAPGSTESVREALTVQQELFFQGTVLYLVLFCGLLFVFGLLYSHRIAGPLYRIQETIRSIAAGHYPARVKFRRYDLLHPFADKLNEVLDALRQQRKERHDDLEAVLQILEEEGDTGEAKRILEDLLARDDVDNKS